MQLTNFACVRVRLRACVCAQKIKCPDTSRRKKFLRPDASFVLGLSGCTYIERPYQLESKRHDAITVIDFS